MSLIKKNRIHSEEDSEGTWAISYGDMITLLLSFFVIFYNADFKAKKIEITRFDYKGEKAAGQKVYTVDFVTNTSK